VDNIKLDLIVMGSGGVEWIGLAQDRHKLSGLLNVVMIFRVLVKFWETIERLQNWWPLE
jgi:hypothetical protein